MTQTTYMIRQIGILFKSRSLFIRLDFFDIMLSSGKNIYVEKNLKSY